MSPAAQEQLARWGLTDFDATQAGLFEVDTAKRVYPDMPDLPAIVIPYHDAATGAPRTFKRAQEQIPFARLRWLRAPPLNGFTQQKPQRYTQPHHSPVLAYFPPDPDWPGVLAHTPCPIILTEGEAKAICAHKHGFKAIAFGGVYSFVDRSGQLLPELDAVDWEGRDVYICYDSDADTNPNVLAAEARLVDALQRQRGARARVVRLPQLGEGKTGLDDYLSAKGAGPFVELCRTAPNLSALDMRVMELNQHVAWIEREGMVYDIEQGMLLKTNSFLQGSKHSTGRLMVTAPGGGVKEVSVPQTWLRHPYAQRYSEILFRPSEGPTVTGDNGQPALNMWTGYREEAGDVAPFLELTRHILQLMAPEHRELPLRLVAYKAQNPELKIPLALVMVGTQGGGKSLWAECLRQAFDPYGRAIVETSLFSHFTGWAERTLLTVVNEMAAKAFLDNAEKLRTLISELRMPMEEKFRPLRDINSYSLFILNSNKRAISSYDVDDRRMVVIDTPPAAAKALYDRVGAWLKRGGGRHLMHWLLTAELGGWKPPQRAPQTAEKAMAHKEGLTVVQELAHDMRTAKQSMVLVWIASALEWARKAEVSNNFQLSQLAKTIIDNSRHYQIRPWYTPQELALMFPSVAENVQGSKLSRSTPAGQISRELREAGIPYLKCKDNPEGFWHKGQLKQYLVVSDFQEWAEPLAQADFDRLIGSFPTYDQLVNERGRR